MGNTKIIYPSLVILFVILLNFFCKSVFNILVIAKFSKCANCTIKLVTNSTATLEYMRKVRTVFCPDFLAQYKSIPLWRSTVFGWTALDPVLTQNPKKAGRAGRKQRNIRRANGGKKHKSEPK